MKKLTLILMMILLGSGAFAQEARKLYVICNASFWAPGGADDSKPYTLFAEVAEWGGHPRPVAVYSFHPAMTYPRPAFPGAAPDGADPVAYYDYEEVITTVSNELDRSAYSGEQIDFVLYSSHSTLTTDATGGAGTEDEFVANAIGWGQVGYHFNTNASLILYEPWPYHGYVDNGTYPSLKAMGDDYHAVTQRAQSENSTNTTSVPARLVPNPLGWEARNWERNLYLVDENGVVDKHAGDFGHVLATLTTYAQVYSNSASAIYRLNPDLYHPEFSTDWDLTSGSNGTNDIDDLMYVLSVDIRSAGETNEFGEAVTMTTVEWQELARLADKLVFAPGDANLDGVVDTADYNMVITNVGVVTSNSIWADGDFDADGDVDQNDIDILNEARSVAILFDTTTLNIPEGSTSNVQVRLSVAPEQDVTVSVERISGDMDIDIAAGGSLIFTTNNWNIYQPVVLVAAQDGDWINGTATIEATASNCTSATVTVYEIDDEVDPTYILPWQETFENEGMNAGTLGDLDSQHGWVSTAATVTNSDAQAGSQSVEIGKGQVSHLFTDGHTNVLTTLWLKPVQAAEPSAISADASAVFYVHTNGNLIAYSNTTPVEISATVSNGWNKFEVQCDYVSKVWNLSLNDVPMLGNFAFYSTSQTGFTELRVVNDSTTNVTFVDTIAIREMSAGNDDDSDGIPNDWEITYFGGATNANPLSIASNGVNTVMECYIAGISPVDPFAKFQISDIRSLISENILHWQNASGRVYAIYWTSNLLSGFQPLESNITVGTFTDDLHGADRQSFYKIVVELE